jgi:hypothetical protein
MRLAMLVDLRWQQIDLTLPEMTGDGLAIETLIL